MAEVERLPRPALTKDIYDPDDVRLHDSPPLRAMKVNLAPSPSSPPVAPLQKVNSESSYHQKSYPGQGDGILFTFMNGGKRPEIAYFAGAQPSASDSEEEEKPEDESDELRALAANAMMKANEGQATQSASQPEQKTPTNKTNYLELNAHTTDGNPMEDVKPMIRSITATYTCAPGELPPYLPQSPQSNLSNGHKATRITLPSIREQLGNIPGCKIASTADSHIAQPLEQPSPSPPLGPRLSHDSLHPQLNQTSTDATSYSNSVRGLSQKDKGWSPTAERSTSDTLSTDRSTPKMRCPYPGCTAQPFQSQYLLNSHAYVHSSDRPHYCSVKGCPRSKGGKGFKRKNELIRHGLVHDSPGYVCPFCLERERKYPRADNLQRHVKVHHADEDNNNTQLQEVLSQRPKGLSTGRRRRRGGTS